MEIAILYCHCTLCRYIYFTNLWSNVWSGLRLHLLLFSHLTFLLLKHRNLARIIEMHIRLCQRIVPWLYGPNGFICNNDAESSHTQEPKRKVVSSWTVHAVMDDAMMHVPAWYKSVCMLFYFYIRPCIVVVQVCLNPFVLFINFLSRDTIYFYSHYFKAYLFPWLYSSFGIRKQSEQLK